MRGKKKRWRRIEMTKMKESLRHKRKLQGVMSEKKRSEENE